MKKFITLLVILVLLSACGAKPASRPAATVTEAQYNQVIADSRRAHSDNMELNGQITELYQKVEALTESNGVLQGRIIEVSNERLLFENAVRDNQTLNKLVRWRAIAWDVRVGFGLLVALFVAFSIVIFAILRSWYAKELMKAQKELVVMRGELCEELKEARKLNKLYRAEIARMNSA